MRYATIPFVTSLPSKGTTTIVGSHPLTVSPAKIESIQSVSQSSHQHHNRHQDIPTAFVVLLISVCVEYGSNAIICSDKSSAKNICPVEIVLSLTTVPFDPITQLVCT